MKKKLLNNRGFAVSVILYTAVTLVALILILVISILSTGWQSKSLIVDNIKEEVSGAIEKKSESLGEIVITASDSKGSGEWHTNDTTLTISLADNTTIDFPITYYYGTSSDRITNVLGNNQIILNTNTSGTNYYIMACRGSNKDICSKVGVYLVKLDKNKPTISVSPISCNWTTSKTLTITPTATSGITYYEYYVSDSSNTPNKNDEIIRYDNIANPLIINEPGLYIHIRAINNANVKGDWNYYNLCVERP